MYVRILSTIHLFILVHHTQHIDCHLFMLHLSIHLKINYRPSTPQAVLPIIQSNLDDEIATGETKYRLFSLHTSIPSSRRVTQARDEELSRPQCCIPLLFSHHSFASLQR